MKNIDPSALSAAAGLFILGCTIVEAPEEGDGSGGAAPSGESGTGNLGGRDGASGGAGGAGEQGADAGQSSSGQGGVNLGQGGAGGAPGGAGNGGTPAERVGLEGTWINQLTSVNSQSSLTTATTMHLDPGGSCRYELVAISTLPGCTSDYATTVDECQWSYDGQTLTVLLGERTVTAHECGGGEESRIEEGRTETWPAVERVEESGETYLLLTDEAGDSSRWDAVPQV